MFVLCPHCQFLVGLEPGSELPPERCPRCRQALLASPTPDVAPVHEETETLPARHEAGPATKAPPPRDEVIAESPEQTAEQAAGPTADDDSTQPAAVDAASSAAPIESIPGTIDVERAADGDAMAAVSTPAPAASALRPARRPRPPSRPLSAAARQRILLASVPLLLILLAMQSLLSDRARLAADARWRPLMSTLCDVLRCELPPWREPEAFTLLDRDVRPATTKPGVLHVTARFRNDARWTQPLPSLLLTLSDADGRIAGERLFQPDEYLADQHSTQKGLASGQSARVALDVVEPPQGVVAFTFDLR